MGVPGLLLTGIVLALGTMAALHGQTTRPPETKGWKVPAGAENETSPVGASPDALSKGKTFYADNCQRCHGATGTGNGPDASPDNRPADLTDGSRAELNPDGVLFYKIWNGRRNPTMPAMNSVLSNAQVWQLVAYVKSLRT